MKSERERLKLMGMYLYQLFESGVNKSDFTDHFSEDMNKLMNDKELMEEVVDESNE